MTTAPTPVEETAHYKAILRELVDMATDLARMVHNQARQNAQKAPETAKDPTIPFANIARTIRRTILLAQSLDHPPKSRENHRIAVRKRILRDVEDQIQRNAEPREKDILRTELRERLESPDLEEEIDHRPTAEIILDICRDLRVVNHSMKDWQRRTPADVERLRTCAAALPKLWTREEDILPRQAPQPKPVLPTRRKYHILA